MRKSTSAVLFSLVLALALVLGAAAGANSWTTNGPNVPGMLWKLALDPTRPATVYAAGSTGSGTTFTPRVFKSTDTGTTWAEVTNGIVNVQINTVRVDPTNGLVVYVGGYNPVAKSLALYRSADGGNSWVLLGWPFTGEQLDRPITSIAIDPTNGNVLYVGTSTGILKSTSGGSSWTAAGTGIPVAANRSIAIDRTNPNVVYAAGDAGVHKSTDAGTTWVQITNGLPTMPVGGGQFVRAHDVVIDPSDPKVLYVVVAPASGGELVFRSSDAGANWSSASSGLPADVIRGLAIDPLQPRTLYAALNGGSGQNLVRTTDAGATWVAFSLPGGGYSSSVVVDSNNPQTVHVGHNDAIWSYTFTGTATASPGAGTATATPAPGTPTVVPTVTGTPTGGTAPRDSRFFAETGYRIDNDAFWNYFNRRGGLKTFGYPISRTFEFLGFPSQFFQRAVMQWAPDGSVRLINLLDPELLPYTSFNNAQMPAVDPALVAAAPAPGSPNYSTAILEYVRAQAPNQFEGLPVNFERTFATTVTYETAYPQGGGDPALLPGINLEMWGVPTSRPAYDPNNRNFVYQRFQRGIMHFDRNCVCTNGILLADYLKKIITGQNLPPDLAAAAQNSRFFRQYNPNKPNWVDRPEQLPGTNLTSAFEQQ